MDMRVLGHSGLSVPPLMLGTWALGGWLWGGTERNRAEEAVLASIDAGITAIDTAPVYGFGLSEELVGRALRGRRREVLLATKCGLVWDDRPGATAFFETRNPDGRPVQVRRCLRKASIYDECEASLRRLGVEAIDLYQCHWPDPETPMEETFEALEQLKARGWIRAYGVSNFSAAQVREALRYGRPVVNQVKYSLLSREVEQDVLPCCRDHGMAILAYSPLEMGLLTGRVGMDRVFPDTDTRAHRPWFAPGKRRAVLDALEAVRPVAERYGVEVGQLAAAWVFSQPGVAAAIAGARDARQAQCNARAAGLCLTPDDRAAIRRVFEPLKLDEAYDPATARR